MYQFSQTSSTVDDSTFGQFDLQQFNMRAATQPQVRAANTNVDKVLKLNANFERNSLMLNLMQICALDAPLDIDMGYAQSLWKLQRIAQIFVKHHEDFQKLQEQISSKLFKTGEECLDFRKINIRKLIQWTAYQMLVERVEHPNIDLEKKCLIYQGDKQIKQLAFRAFRCFFRQGFQQTQSILAMTQVPQLFQSVACEINLISQKIIKNQENCVLKCFYDIYRTYQRLRLKFTYCKSNQITINHVKQLLIKGVNNITFAIIPQANLYGFNAEKSIVINILPCLTSIYSLINQNRSQLTLSQLTQWRKIIIAYSLYIIMNELSHFLVRDQSTFGVTHQGSFQFQCPKEGKGVSFCDLVSQSRKNYQQQWGNDSQDIRQSLQSLKTLASENIKLFDQIFPYVNKQLIKRIKRSGQQLMFSKILLDIKNQITNKIKMGQNQSYNRVSFRQQLSQQDIQSKLLNNKPFRQLCLQIIKIRQMSQVFQKREINNQKYIIRILTQFFDLQMENKPFMIMLENAYSSFKDFVVDKFVKRGNVIQDYINKIQCQFDQKDPFSFDKFNKKVRYRIEKIIESSSKKDHKINKKDYDSLMRALKQLDTYQKYLFSKYNFALKGQNFELTLNLLKLADFYQMIQKIRRNRRFLSILLQVPPQFDKCPLQLGDILQKKLFQHLYAKKNQERYISLQDYNQFVLLSNGRNYQQNRIGLAQVQSHTKRIYAGKVSQSNPILDRSIVLSEQRV